VKLPLFVLSKTLYPDDFLQPFSFSGFSPAAPIPMNENILFVGQDYFLPN